MDQISMEDEDEIDLYIDEAATINNTINSSIFSSPHTFEKSDEIKLFKKNEKESILNNNENNDNKNNNNNNNTVNQEDEEQYINQSIKSRVYYFFKSKPSTLYNTIHCAIGFLFIFFGYSPTQSLITHIHTSNGPIGLSLLYFSFSVGCFIAPLILKKIGLIKSLVIAAFTYAVFIFCTITGEPFLEAMFLPASILVGLGAGLLWTAQPVYVSRNAPPHQEGLYFGMFQTINSMGNIIGNAVSGALREGGLKSTYILCILGSSALLGSLTLAFLRRVDPAVATPRKSFLKTFTNTFHVFKDRKFVLLIPLFIVQGQSQAYFYETINNFISIERIGYISVVMGIVNVIGSSFWGRLNDYFEDKKGKIVLAWSMAFLCVLSLALASISYRYEEIPLFYILAGVNGLFDSLQTILIFVTISSLYVDNVHAFSTSRFLMSISTAFGFLIFGYLKFFIVIFWILFLLVVSQISFHKLMSTLKVVILPTPPTQDDDYNHHELHHQPPQKLQQSQDNEYEEYTDNASSYSMDDRI